MNYIIIVGAAQALLALAIFVMNHKNNGRHDNILSFLLISIFLHLTITFILNVFWPDAEIHQQFNTFIALAYPGLLWYYASYLTGRERNSSLIMVMLPALIASVGYFSVAVYVLTHQGNTPPFIKVYNSVSGYAYTALYILYPVRSLLCAARISQFWKMEKHLIRFASILFLSVGISFLFVLCYNRLSQVPLHFPSVHLTLRILIYSILLIISISIIYVKVHSFFYIHSYRNDTRSEPGTPSLTKPRLRKAETVVPHDLQNGHPLVSAETRKVTGIDYGAIMEKVERVMKSEKAYADSELTLDSLASMVGVSRHHLSETLNQYLGKSFYQFVNECRIKEVVTLMDQCKSKSESPNILSLAFEAGFNSKSTFNLYFKKVQGCTPSAYLKERPRYVLTGIDAV